MEKWWLWWLIPAGLVAAWLLYGMVRDRIIAKRHPRATAAAKAYAERFGTAKRIVIPDDYREAEDKKVEAALSAHELYRLRTAQAQAARIHYVESLHEQGIHHQCSTDCPTVVNVNREMDEVYTRENLKVVIKRIHDVPNDDLEEFAATISDEMKRRRNGGEKVGEP